MLSVLECVVMFGEEINLVDVAWVPLEGDEVGRDGISEPEETHIHGFGFSWLHGVGEKSMA